jgi:vesicular inhibitory amino acid transporter
MHLQALAQAGGANSIENFARSWTRAAGFLEVTPRQHSFVLSTDQDTDREDEEAITYGRRDAEYRPLPRISLLRARLEGSSPEVSIDDDSLSPAVTNDPSTSNQLSQHGSEGKRLGSEIASGSFRSNSIFGTGAHLTTPLVGSYGTSYGTVHSILSESSMAHAGYLWRQQQAGRAGGETQPIIVKEVEQDGKIVLVVAGQSTLPQTIFNSTNVLIGVGLLSLPMGIRYSGWICGMAFLLLSAIVTAYTAGLLAKCMDVDPSLITFADLAFVSYGQRARIATSVLFTLELLAACVALVVLFADTLDLLIPGVGINNWKIICGLLLLPLNFTPLRLLSITSIVGIFSCFCSECSILRILSVTPWIPIIIAFSSTSKWMSDCQSAISPAFSPSTKPNL